MAISRYECESRDQEQEFDETFKTKLEFVRINMEPVMKDRAKGKGWQVAHDETIKFVVETMEEIEKSNFTTVLNGIENDLERVLIMTAWFFMNGVKEASFAPKKGIDSLHRLATKILDGKFAEMAQGQN